MEKINLQNNPPADISHPYWQLINRGGPQVVGKPTAEWEVVRDGAFRPGWDVCVFTGTNWCGSGTDQSCVGEVYFSLKDNAVLQEDGTYLHCTQEGVWWRYEVRRPSPTQAREGRSAVVAVYGDYLVPVEHSALEVIDRERDLDEILPLLRQTAIAVLTEKEVQRVLDFWRRTNPVAVLRAETWAWAHAQVEKGVRLFVTPFAFL